MIDLLLLLILSLLLLICVLGISILLAAFITGVPFVPTHKEVLKKMIDTAQPKKGETCYDLGSGLGHILFEAPKNLQRIGYERIIFLVWGSQIRNMLKKDNVQFYKKDFFKTDFSKADIIFCYLFPKIMNRFHEEIWPTLPKGCRVISNGFPLKPIEPVKTIKMEQGTIYLYIKA